MKAKFIFLLLIVGIVPVWSQKYISKTGHIWFYSHTPMEEIEAHNRQSVSIIDSNTGDISFSLLIKSFEFKNALMQEHFNENYMESNKFPKALFKGSILGNDKVNYKKDGVYSVEVTGDITIHGVTRKTTSKGTLEVKGETVTAKAKFILKPKDFEIKIPSLVENKIAKELEVTLDVSYNLFKQ